MKKVLSIILTAVMAVSCLSFSAGAKKAKIKAPKLKYITQTSLTSAKISWSKASGAKGYVLYYSTTGRGYKKLVTTSKKSYTHKKLKNNKKYYYKLKSYKKVKGKKKYSKYSNIKTIRCTNYLVNLHNPYRVKNFEIFKGIKSFKMNDTKYYNGFVFSTCSPGEESFADFNLKGKYSKIQFTFGYDDSTGFTEAEDTLNVIADNEVIKTYELKYGDLIKTVTLNINNANKLEFLIVTKDGSQFYLTLNKIGFANIRVFK